MISYMASTAKVSEDTVVNFITNTPFEERVKHSKPKK